MRNYDLEFDGFSIEGSSQLNAALGSTNMPRRDYGSQQVRTRKPTTSIANDLLPFNLQPQLPAPNTPAQAAREAPRLIQDLSQDRSTLLSQLDCPGIVQPIDKSKKLRAQNYDPTNIARDILLAIGQHPTLAGLNDHLKGLKDTFIQVDENSDLGTFRWGLAPPGSLDFLKGDPRMSGFFAPQQPKQLPVRRGDASHTTSRASTFQQNAPNPSVDTRPHNADSGAKPLPVADSGGYSGGQQLVQTTIKNYTSIHPAPGSQTSVSSFAPPARASSSTGPENGWKNSALLTASAQGTSKTIKDRVPPQPKQQLFRLAEYSKPASPSTSLQPVRRAPKPLIPNELPSTISTATGYRRNFVSDPSCPASSNSSPLTANGRTQQAPGSHLQRHKGASPTTSFMSLGSKQINSASYRPSLLRNDSSPGTSEPESEDPLSRAELTQAPFYRNPSSSKTKYRPYVSLPAAPSPSSARPRDQPVKSSTSGFIVSPSHPVVEILSPPQKRRRRPYANGTPAKSNTPGPKKRARPFSTPEVAARAAAKVRGGHVPRQQHRHEHDTEKKGGRPFKIRNHFEVPPPSGPFKTYGCEWKCCRAELMNMELLRLHMHMIHDKKTKTETGGVWQCCWGKCARTRAKNEALDKRYSLVRAHDDKEDEDVIFDSKQDLREHIEKYHMVPFSWYMGDGPKGPDLELQNPAKERVKILSYLYDSDNVQITPSVFDPPQTLERGRAKDNNGKRFKRLIKEMNHGREPDKNLFANMMVAKSAVLDSEDTSETGAGSPEKREESEDPMLLDEFDEREEEDDDGGDEMEVDEEEVERGPSLYHSGT